MPVLSFDNECEFSGLPQATCAHCTGDVDEDFDITPEDEFEIVAVFEAQWSGHCTIDWDHPKIYRGDKVSKVQRTNNPFIPVTGVACKHCTKELPYAKH